MDLKFILKYLLVVSMFILMNSCNEDYLVINSKFSNPIADSKTENIYFFHNLYVGQPPKGVSRFPDGGKHKVVYKNLSLYCFNSENKSVELIFDFGTLAECAWNEYLSLGNEKLVFSLNLDLC